MSATGAGERVVVAAPYPTMPGAESSATFALVRRLVDAGDDVIVVSPAPSAAHHIADPGGPRGALRLARLAAGADRLVLRLDAAALRAGTDDRRLLPGRLALRRAMDRAARVDLRLDRVPSTVHPRFASLVVAPAARVTVATDAERHSLVDAGVDAVRVVVEPDAVDVDEDAAGRRAAVAAIAPAATGTSPAEDLERLLRQRAAAVRALSQRPSATPEGTASLPLRHLVRMERAQVRSAKPGGAFVKRAIAKVLAWQFDNVIQHVNQLHQATIDAIDNLEAERSADED